ncbi:MAG: hypothetical protein ACYDB1_00815 [Acidiferrobacteraceae bacterium]
MPAISNFPNGFNFGINVRGLNILNSYAGNIWWVDSTSGADGNPGTFTQPFATVGGALTQATASNGDIVLCAPGHTETFTAAGGLTLSVAGVAVVGLGIGRNRPTFKFSTAATASILVSAANCALTNCVIDATGYAAVANPVNIQAADFAFVGNEMVLTDSTNQAVLGVLTNASANRFLCIGNRFLGSTDAGTTCAVKIVGGDSIVIADNWMEGAYTTTLGGINNATTACTNTQVTGNFINNMTAASTVAMTFVSTSTGMIANNRMQILSGTAPIVGAAMSWVGGNYYAAVVATAGTLI